VTTTDAAADVVPSDPGALRVVNATNVTPVGVTFVSVCVLRGRRLRAELANRADRTSDTIAAPVAELVNHRDGDRDVQRGQHHQEDHDREEHWISRILRGRNRWPFVLGNSSLSS